MHLQIRKNSTPGSRFGQNSRVIFLLWWLSKHLICPGNLFPNDILSDCFHSPQAGFCDNCLWCLFCSLPSSPNPCHCQLLGEAAPNNGDYGLSKGSVHSARGHGLCWKLSWEQRELLKVHFYWYILFSFLKCMPIITWAKHAICSSSFISDFQWVYCLCCGQSDSWHCKTVAGQFRGQVEKRGDAF